MSSCRLLFLLLLLVYNSGASPSDRSVCLLQCYSLCMQSGTASPSLCNCPVEKTAKKCDSFLPVVANAHASDWRPEVKTSYEESRSIKVQLSPNPAAFVYVFEYSMVSTSPNDWLFAGVSTTPSMTINVLDPCRDYQFRRTVCGQTVVQVKIEAPMVANSSDLIKMFVTWNYPSGYSEQDVYGYESPALYPIQCATPEDELPMPTIEATPGGGRLAVRLPASVLTSRCRIWVEVRMLPRCVRLEPFNIQKNIEIDCSKNTELEICSREINPICMEAMSIDGDQGKAKVTWAAPAHGSPLYYHVRYGPAQMKGAAPFVSWQLAAKREVRVDGSLTSLSLDIPEDEDFGIQVCAIVSSKRKRPKFGVVKVIPFMCNSCKITSSGESGKCGKCMEIEGTTVLESRWGAVPLPAVIKKQESVIPIEADLDIAGPVNNTVPVVNSDKKHVVQEPIGIEKAELINSGQDEDDLKVVNDELNTPEEGDTFLNITMPMETEMTTTSTAPITTTTTTTTTTSTTTPAPTTTSSTTTTTTTRKPVPTTTSTTTTTTTTTISTTPSTTTLKMDGAEVTEDRSKEKKNKKKDELGESVRKLEEAMDAADNGSVTMSLEDFFEATTASKVLSVETEKKIEEAARDLHDKLKQLVSSPEIRKHEKSKKCLLSDGRVCEFGCETKKKCICPPTHLRMKSGICIQRENILHSTCLRRRDFNASYNPETGNIFITDKGVLRDISDSEYCDMVYLEFGRIEEIKERNNIMRYFLGEMRTRSILTVQKAIESQLFATEPFVLHVNNTIDDKYQHGLQICLYNSSQVKNPYENEWDENDDEAIPELSKFQLQSVEISKIHFSEQLTAEEDQFPGTILKITLVTVVVVVILLLIYMNCTRIRVLYDRKRTRYFRPYLVDPGIRITTLGNAPCQSATYFDQRTQII